MTILNAALAYQSDPPGPLTAHNAWTEGKDFRVINPPIDWPGGTYFSIRDTDMLKQLGYTTVAIRLRHAPGKDQPRIYEVLL